MIGLIGPNTPKQMVGVHPPTATLDDHCGRLAQFKRSARAFKSLVVPMALRYA